MIGVMVYREEAAFIDAVDLAFRHRAGRLQADGHSVVGECEFGAEKIRLSAEIPLLPPHVIERDKATLSLQPRPAFFGKELGHPCLAACAPRASVVRGHRPSDGRMDRAAN